MINNKKPTFFIGYDSKEDIAYRVCKQSLLLNSSIDINVISLKLSVVLQLANSSVPYLLFVKSAHSSNVLLPQIYESIFI